MLDAIIEGIADALGHGVPDTVAQRTADRASRSRWRRLRLPWRRDQGPAGRVLLAAERDPDTVHVIYPNPPEERQMWRAQIVRTVRKGVTQWDMSFPQPHREDDLIPVPNSDHEITLDHPGVFQFRIDQHNSVDGSYQSTTWVVANDENTVLLTVSNILETEKRTIESAREQLRGMVWESLRRGGQFQ